MADKLFGLTTQQMDLVRETVMHYVRLYGGGQRGKTKNQDQRCLQCKLTSDLLAAVDSWTDPSTATAHVFRKYNGTDDMKWSGDTITIVNRFENISVDSGTYCKAEWIDGEWQLYAADCPASFSQSSLTVSVDPSASVSTGGP